MKTPSSVVALLLAASCLAVSEASHIEQKTHIGQKTVIHLSLLSEADIEKHNTHRFVAGGDDDEVS
jgi:hypothetical protein